MSQDDQIQKMSFSSEKTEIQDKRIDTLFTRLGAIYGYIWWSSFQSEHALTVTKKEWSSALQRFDNRTIRDALLIFRERHHFPPTLPQFIECCKSISQKNIFRKSVEEFDKQAFLEAAELNIKAMLDILKG
ncbi:Vir protein [Legionella sp. D16C41]|uniref:Vir protein n=1 Tax=Legionella sp. D16C41 TaxID=3402688 RepID=UPI003AF845D9